MDDWEKFSETSLPVKEDFYSHLIMKDITDAYFAHPESSDRSSSKKFRRIS